MAPSSLQHPSVRFGFIVGAGALGGLAYGVGHPGVGPAALAVVGVLVWVAIVDLIASEPFEQAPRWRVLTVVGSGFAFGLAAFLSATPYLADAAGAYLGLGARRRLVAHLAIAGYHAIEYVLLVGAASWACRRGAPLAWAILVPFIVLEWIFPRLGRDYLAFVVHDVPPVASIASLGGPTVVSAFLVCLVVALYELLRAAWRRAPVPWRTLRAPLGLAAALLLAGLLPRALAKDASSPPLRVLVVQPNIDPRDHEARATTEARLRALTSGALAGAAEPPDWIAWPESALPDVLPADPSGEVASRFRDARIPHLFGAVIADDTDEPAFNAALVAGPDGVLAGRYDKIGLMPFSESLPLGDYLPDGTARWLRLRPATRGTRSAIVRVGHERAGVMICYEDLLPELLFDAFRGNPPEVLVTLSNDGWFGRSAEIEQHLAYARFRAIEWGLPFLRVTQTGATVLIGPGGELLEALPHHAARAAIWEVPRATIPTPFRWLGPWPGPVAAILALVWLFAQRRSAVAS